MTAIVLTYLWFSHSPIARGLPVWMWTAIAFDLIMIALRIADSALFKSLIARSV